MMVKVVGSFLGHYLPRYSARSFAYAQDDGGGRMRMRCKDGTMKVKVKVNVNGKLTETVQPQFIITNS